MVGGWRRERAEALFPGPLRLKNSPLPWEATKSPKMTVATPTCCTIQCVTNGQTNVSEDTLANGVSNADPLDQIRSENISIYIYVNCRLSLGVAFLEPKKYRRRGLVGLDAASETELCPEIAIFWGLLFGCVLENPELEGCKIPYTQIADARKLAAESLADSAVQRF